MDLHANECNKLSWIHLLLRGDGSDGAKQIDDYEQQFRDLDLVAMTIPVLRFTYKNIQILVKYLCDIKDERSSEDNAILHGIIITSPRVVESLRMALDFISDRDAIKRVIDGEHVYVVGEATAKACEENLRIAPNRESAASGNSRNLIDYIKHGLSRLSSQSKLNLLYPKGSLTDNSFEEAFSQHDSISITPVVVYNTSAREDLKEVILRKILESDLNLILTNSSKVVFNFVFFSPSGVKGFAQSCKGCLLESIKDYHPQVEFESRYTSIGNTTRLSLEQNGIPVFCCAEKPTATSLVNCIVERMNLASETLKQKINS